MKIQLIRNAALRLTYAVGIDPFLAPKHSPSSYAGRSLWTAK